MKYTEHYQLNQWEANDKVQRIDFNRDNEKIDRALGALSEQVSGKVERSELEPALAGLAEADRLVKLREVVLPSDGPQVDIDLSDIDLLQYHHLDIQVLPRPGKDYSATIVLQVNHLTKGYRYGETEQSTFSSAPVGTVPEYFNHLCFRIYLGPFLMARADYGYFYANRPSYPSDTPLLGLLLGAQDLQSVQVAGVSGVPLAAGCRVIIYGMKK